MRISIEYQQNFKFGNKHSKGNKPPRIEFIRMPCLFTGWKNYGHPIASCDFRVDGGEVETWKKRLWLAFSKRFFIRVWKMENIRPLHHTHIAKNPFFQSKRETFWMITLCGRRAREKHKQKIHIINKISSLLQTNSDMTVPRNAPTWNRLDVRSDIEKVKHF